MCCMCECVVGSLMRSFISSLLLFVILISRRVVEQAPPHSVVCHRDTFLLEFPHYGIQFTCNFLNTIRFNVNLLTKIVFTAFAMVLSTMCVYVWVNLPSEQQGINLRVLFTRWAYEYISLNRIGKLHALKLKLIWNMDERCVHTAHVTVFCHFYMEFSPSTAISFFVWQMQINVYSNSYMESRNEKKKKRCISHARSHSRRIISSLPTTTKKKQQAFYGTRQNNFQIHRDDNESN